jgi:hypothetical protein
MRWKYRLWLTKQARNAAFARFFESFKEPLSHRGIALSIDLHLDLSA